MSNEKTSGGQRITKLGAKKPTSDAKLEAVGGVAPDPAGGVQIMNTISKKPASTTSQSESTALASDALELKTRSQTCAAAVYGKVKAVEGITQKGDALRKKYGGMAHKLPVLIRTAGLAQALAFVESKGNDGWDRLLLDLNAVVGKTKGKDLLQASLSEDIFTYMYLTRKATDALVWFKRFAVSVLGVKLDADDAPDGDEQPDEGDAAQTADAEQGAQT